MSNVVSDLKSHDSGYLTWIFPLEDIPLVEKALSGEVEIARKLDAGTKYKVTFDGGGKEVRSVPEGKVLVQLHSASNELPSGFSPFWTRLDSLRLGRLAERTFAGASISHEESEYFRHFLREKER